MKALVTGGYSDRSGEVVIWSVDLETERVEPLRRRAPPEHLHVEPKVFAGESLGDDGMSHVAAHAAVVRIDPLRAAVRGVLDQPCMNDRHHVANVGLSAVGVFRFDGSFPGSHTLLPAWANSRRITGEDVVAAAPPVHPGRSGDLPAPWPSIRHDDGYRESHRSSSPSRRLKVPGYLHVSLVATLRDPIVPACFADGTLRDLYDLSEVAGPSGHCLRDGDGDRFWLTATHGSVVELDQSTFSGRRRVDEFATGCFRWCRRLAPTDDHWALGFTGVRKRPPVGKGDAATEGSETSVLLLGRLDGRRLARVLLSDSRRHSKIFSILPAQTLG